MKKTAVANLYWLRANIPLLKINLLATLGISLVATAALAHTPQNIGAEPSAWQFRQLVGGDFRDAAAYVPMALDAAKGEWGAAAGNPSQGGQPAALFQDGKIILVGRGPWTGSAGDKLSALLFRAPAAGTYSARGTVSINLWEGGSLPVLSVCVLDAKTQGGARMGAVEFGAKNETREFVISDIVVKNAGDEVVIVPTFDTWHVAATFTISDLKIVLEKNSPATAPAAAASAPRPSSGARSAARRADDRIVETPPGRVMRARQAGVSAAHPTRAGKLILLGGRGGAGAVVEPSAMIESVAGNISNLRGAELLVTPASPGNPETLKGAVTLHKMLRPFSPLRDPVAGVDFEAAPFCALEPDAADAKKLRADLFGFVAEAVKNPARDFGFYIASQSREIQIHGMGDSMPPQLRLALAPVENKRLFGDDVKIRAGVYVTTKDGHLNYGGERLRLWGTLGGYSGTERLRKMGFNAWRLWGGDPSWVKDLYTVETVRTGEFARLNAKGDAHPLEAFDAYFASLKARDIFISATQLMGTIPIDLLSRDDSFVAGGDDWAAWKSAVAEGKDSLHYFALVDERLMRARRKHISNILNHKNPHTGRRYAEEEAIAIFELQNEWQAPRALLEYGAHEKWPAYFQAKFAAKWNAWLLARYRNDAALAAAWGGGSGGLEAGESLAGGTVATAPKHEDRKKFSEARGGDFVRFVEELCLGYFKELEAHSRAQAPKGVGVNVIPFSYDTQYRPSTPWHYVNAQADVMNFGMYFWDMDSALTRPPSMYVMDSHTVAGKPTVIYETNRGRPSPYRAEYPYMLAAFASWQDWDAIFFHYWGGLADGAADEEYLARHLMPPAESHFWNAVHHNSDPAMCSAMAAAGEIFRNGLIRPAPAPAVREAGADSIFGYKDYFGVPDAGLDVFTKGSKVAFNPALPKTARSGKKPSAAAGALVSEGGEITWDWPNGRLIIDTPTACALVGAPAAHTFRNGIAVSGFNTAFASFAMVSRDGKPLADASSPGRSILVSAVFDAKNTDFAMDMSANLNGPVEQAKAVRFQGQPPAIVDSVDYTISFPLQISGTFTSYDFALRSAASDAVASNTVRMRGGRGGRGGRAFLSVLDIAAWGGAAAVAVDPLSAPGAGNAAAALALDIPRTDAKLARLYNPLPGMSWGDNARLAHKKAADNALGAGGVSEIRQTPDGRAAFTIRDCSAFFDASADIDVIFGGDAMREILVKFRTPPVFSAAVNEFTRLWGAPTHSKISTQEYGSEVRWTLPDGIGVALADVQNDMSIHFELKK